ncbi:MAG: YwqG family protein [Anaerolineae bacterium]
MSKVGGLPDLPPEFAWPEVDGFVLDFVAQINLTEVKPFDKDDLLPSLGILYFFYDIDRSLSDYKNSTRFNRTLYFDGDTSLLRRREWPVNRHQYATSYAPCVVNFRNELTLPYYESTQIMELLNWSWETRNYKEREGVDAYVELQVALETPHTQKWVEHNRILGYGDAIQGDVREEAAAIRLLGSWDSWVTSEHLDEVLKEQLLIQIDSIDAAKMMWGDVGRLYFSISQPALAARQFDETVCVMQCT